MLRRRTDALAALGAVLLLLGTVYLRSTQDRTPSVSLFSSYDTGRNGYRALYEVLGRERVDVLRYEYPLGLLSRNVRTLVFPPGPLGSPGGAFGRPSGDAAALAEWTKEGGTLVAFWQTFGSSDWRALGLAAKTYAPKNPSSIARPFLRAGQTRGVRAVRGRFETLFRLTKASQARPLLGTAAGAAAIAYRLGKGEIVAISDPTVFSNLRLGSRDNARFAYDVLARGPVAFYERVNGYAVDRSFWDALPRSARIAVFCVAAIALLGLIGSNIRFAPALSPDNAPERDSSAYIVSMARLLARGHAASRAIDDTAQAVSRALRRRFGGGSRAPLATFAPRLDDPETRAAILELERLRVTSNPSDRELLRAGKLGARLRKVFE